MTAILPFMKKLCVKNDVINKKISVKGIGRSGKFVHDVFIRFLLILDQFNKTLQLYGIGCNKVVDAVSPSAFIYLTVLIYETFFRR